MGVLKSIRKRNQEMSRRLSHRKLLNYSSISNGSGDTVQEDIDDLNEAATPLFLEDMRTSSKLDSAADEFTDTEATSLSLFQDFQKPLVQSEKQPKRKPVEPIGPLGVVVNENEWDAISHISGISTRTSSTTKSPCARNMSSEEIQNDLAMMMQTAEAAGADTPNVVSPGPEDKKESSALNTSRDSSKGASRNGSAIEEGPGVKINVVTNDAEEDRIVRILKTVDSKDGSGSKVSHVFEDDQDSSANVVLIDNTATVATTSIYSEGLPMPTTVSPSTTPNRNKQNPSTPVFEAVFDADYKEKQFERPSIRGALAPSFDGSTATIGTNNTTNNKSCGGSTISICVDTGTKSGASSGTTTPAANNTTEPVMKDKVHEKLNEIEVTMRSSCAGIGGVTESHDPVNGSPACDTLFASTSALSENFKDSLLHIKRELTGLYESSGLASASSSVAASLEEPFCAIKGCSEPNLDELMDESRDHSKEVSFSTTGSDTECKDASYSTAGSGTECTSKTEFTNIMNLSTVSEEDSKANQETPSQEVGEDNASRSPTQASF